MVRFRTIRQRRTRARKGQVAAVATVLGLLLVTTFISNYLQEQLPGQVTDAEFGRIINVENQLARLQSTIIAQVHSVAPGLSLSSPVTLGSAAVPPFGPPDAGSIVPDSALSRLTGSYALGTIVQDPPQWGFGSTCLSGGSGSCASNGNIDTWNVTNENDTSFTITVHGNSNSVAYNISGNNDTINVDWTGGDTGFVYMQINGSDDQVIYNKGGSDTNAPVATILFFGQRDTFDYNPSGSHSGKGGMTVTVAFVGTLSELCPYGNLSNSDKVGTLSSGGSNLNLTILWWNAVGYISGPNSQAYPGGGSNNETINWWNKTGIVSCPFTRAYSTTYTASFGEGILVHLINRYLPPTDVVYEQGAVIEDQLGGIPVMVSPPDLTTAPIPAGESASLTLINLVGNFTSENGYGTAAVSTRLLSTQTFVVQNGRTADDLTTPLFLNISTAYPSAWISFLHSLPTIFPYGTTCTEFRAISPPNTCADPPEGVLVQLSTIMEVVQLTVTSISVAVSID
jgi:hypothetical protein